MSVLSFLKTQKQKRAQSDLAWKAAWQLCCEAHGKTNMRVSVTLHFVFAVVCLFILFTFFWGLRVTIYTIWPIASLLPTLLAKGWPHITGIYWSLLLELLFFALSAAALAFPLVASGVHAKAWRIQCRSVPAQ